MSYLGNAPARSFISFERQVFSIVNSQTAYALSHSVTNENDIRLVVNNVVQEPGSGKAYTATGTALTLSAALTNGTDEMYCVFLGRATATNAPGAGSVGTVQLADLNVTSGKIANDAVTLAKMASGTDGNIISYDTSGNPVAVATGSAGQFLKSAGAGAPPVFETPAAGGKILQVIYASTTTEKVVSSATFVDTGLAASITPSASNSKILVICEISSIGKANSNTRVVLKLFKGSSALITFAQEVAETGDNSSNKVGNSGCTYLDSPNTTNAVTYKVQMNSGAGSSYGQTGGSGGASTMTLMEVGA